MQINILETKFETSTISEGQLLLEPTKNMHAIEEWEVRLDKRNIPYALVECCKTTKHTSVFLGWSLATELLRESTIPVRLDD